MIFTELFPWYTVTLITFIYFCVDLQEVTDHCNLYLVHGKISIWGYKKCSCHNCVYACLAIAIAYFIMVDNEC